MADHITPKGWGRYNEKSELKLLPHLENVHTGAAHVGQAKAKDGTGRSMQMNTAAAR